MNIFYVDKDPTIAAQSLCNAHVRSQIKESMQMMSVAHYLHGADIPGHLPITHKNHPSTVWVRASNKNYEWMREHLRALLDEYKLRWGVPNRYEPDYHLYELIPQGLPWSSSYSHSAPPAVVSPDLKPTGDAAYTYSQVIWAYRAYYNREKRHLFHWMVRPRPDWILDDAEFAKQQEDAEAFRKAQEIIKAQQEGTITDGTTHP